MLQIYFNKVWRKKEKARKNVDRAVNIHTFLCVALNLIEFIYSLDLYINLGGFGSHL